MEAIILAGGLGTRLRDKIGQHPKPLALVGGKPFLCYLLAYLEQQGIRRAILSVGYKKALIVQTLGTSFGSLQLDYATEEVALGTGGAIKNALAFTRAPEVFVVNGDTLFKVNYQKMQSLRKNASAALVMAVKPMDDCSRYGQVMTERGRIKSLGEKAVSGPGLINGGVYLMHTDIFKSFTLPQAFSFERNFLAAHLREIVAVAYPSEGYFIDMGIPADYERAKAEVPNQVQVN